MKTVALDIGDVWVGVAISDALGMFARPYDTTKADILESFLKKLLVEEPITTIVIGHPKTMRGTISEQTKKIEATHAQLTQLFPTVSWILWDERLSSKRAEGLKKGTKPEDKKQSHAIAAAFILSSYLDYQRFHQPIPQEEE